MNEKKRTELVEKRSAHRKVFENADHTFTAEIYLDAVHYQDEDGSWKEMDDCLVEEDTEELPETEIAETKAEKSGIKEKIYFNKKGKFQFRMKEHAGERGMFTLKDGEAELRWGIEGAGAVDAIQFNERKLCYPEILPGVEMRCCTTGERVKEDFILTSAEADNEFTYFYELDGLTPVQYRNSVGFLDMEGTEHFRVSAPYMKDAAGNKSEATMVTLDTQGKETAMTMTEEGSCRIIFTADKEWLTAPERVYPVTLDPVTTTSKERDDIMDAHVDSLYEEDNFQQSIILKTRGGDNIQRSFVKFELPEMKTGDMVVGARLVLASFAEDNKERSIAVHKVLHPWSSSTINWNNKPLYEETVQDICRYTADKAKYITFDITRLVKDWYQNGKNYGLMFKDEYEIFGRYTEYQSSDSDDDFEGQRPRIEISYMNYSGIEDYWSYHTQDVGRAGTVYVNDYNGNLILVHDTLSMGGSRLPISLAHVYNSNDKDTDIGYGYGIRLNYHQRLTSVTIADTKYYKHVDDNGTVHYFYKDEEGVWKDEAITDRTLTEESDGTFTIKDKEDNQLVFSSSGYLKKVIDNNEQTLSIAYSNKRISKLTDAAGRIVKFTYAECSDGESRLSKVTAPDGREKTFTYSDEGMLTEITDVDGTVLTYTYYNRRLTKVRNADGYNVRYTYHTAAKPYRVKTVTEYADTTKGNALTLVYGHNSTKFTDHKGNTEIYRFNNLGNLLHIHDGHGHAASAKYDREGNQVNHLKNATKMQDNIVQLLKNPAMLDGSTGWQTARYPDAEAGECTLNTSSSYCMVGSNSLRCYCGDLEGYAGWRQNVTIRKGVTYTASMYVRASITEVGDGGVLLRVRYTDSNGNDRYINSECLKRTTAGFVRLFLTFTIPEDAQSEDIRFYMMVRHAIGTAYGDLAQLEVGDTANRCNLIDNGALHLGKDTDYVKSGDAEDVLTTVGTSERVSFHHNLVVVKSSTVLYGDATADESDKVATLMKDTHVSGFAAVVEKISTSTTKTWYHVVTESGKYGYVVSSDVAAYVSSGDSLTAGVVAVTTDLMASASSEGERVKWSVTKQCPLVVISSKTDSSGKLWYRVGLNIDNDRYIGYLPTEAVTQLYMERYYRTFTQAVSLYSQPSASSSIIKTYSADTQLRIAGIVTDASGTDWYAVKTGSVYGYLKGSLVEDTEDLLLSRRNREKVEEGVPGLDDHIFKIYGRSDKDKKWTKKLAISGKKGDTFLVNAWGKGTPLPETDNDGARRFGVEVVFVASDGTEDVHYTNFSPDILDWQFLSDVYVAKKAYTSVKVSYTYCHQANTAYFDGLALFKEEFGQTYTYDEDNNVISVVDNQSNTQKFEYNSTNDMTGVTDAKGNSFTYEYDKKHRVTKGTSAEGVVYRFTYDTAGNVLKSAAVDPLDTAKGTWITRTMTEDKNHVASVKDAEGNKVQYTWDTDKDIVNSLTDANGNELAYTYDALSRLTKVSQSATVNGAAKTVSNVYAYADDRLSSITHNGFKYGFTYNGFGNTTAVSIAGTKVIGHTYGFRNGNLTKTTYGNGTYIRYVYDAQDRVTETYYSDSSSGAEALLDSYVYDKQGNLVQVTNHPSGKTYHLSYDFLDRLMRTRDEEGNICEYTYDANNQMTRMRHIHTAAYGNTYYTYDKDGREATVRAASTATRETFYDQFGRVSAQQWTDADGNIFTGVNYEYPSSGNNRSTRPNAMNFGARLLSYTYDGNGNITKIEDSSLTGGTTIAESYVYDERNQLIRENSKSQNKTFVYAYDAGGNLTSVKEYAYTTGTLGSVVKTITGTYASTWKDQLTKWNGEAITYDAIGNMLTHGDTSYTWTQGRKLASVVKNGVTSKYLYDHTGMRVSKTVDGVETRYRYAGRLLLSEKATGGKTLFFRYDSISNLISMTYNSNVYFYVKNLQGDIIGLVNTAGEMVVEYKYDAWGKVLEISGSLASTIGKKNPFRYRGYYYDSETEMYYLANRYYDPEVKRFINADSMEVFNVEVNNILQNNLFLYCNNNPVNHVDLTGEFAIGTAIMGAVINVATSWVAAKVTGQEMSWIDIAVAAVSGFVSGLYPSKYLTYTAGVISGGYAFYVALDNGAGIGKAAISGFSAAYGTICIGGLSGEAEYLEEVVSVIFNFGGNLTSTAVGAGVSASVANGDGYTVSYNNPKEKRNYRYTVDDMRKEQRYLRKMNMRALV